LKNGCLIVFEGIDGSGKSTQCARLADKLRNEGWDVVRLQEPTAGPFGRKIRELAANGRDGVTPEEELQLFIEDRKENVQNNILPAMERGAVVVMDRYYYSTIAYQGARGLNPAYIRAENEKFAPPADLLLYLHIPVEMVTGRIEGSRKGTLDHFEKGPYLQKVKAIFDTMQDKQLVRIDAAQDEESVFEEVWRVSKDFLGKTMNDE